MTRAEKFIKIVFGAEGFYSNDKDDKGGETIYGIARNYHPKWLGWAIVDTCKKLPKFPWNMKGNQKLVDLKNAFYKAEFYDKVRADEIGDEELALQVFDFAVNAGIVTSIKMLQSLAGATCDGIIGKQTLMLVNSKDLTEKFKQTRKEYYKSIGHGTNAKFLKGWLNRVDNISNEL